MRQPAYAKHLVEQRRAGVHPPSVTVIYGNDWRVNDDVVRLAVKPGEARELKWSCVAGLPVQVIDRAAPAEDPPDEAGNREVFFLLGEIAPFAARLELISPEPLTSADPARGPGRALAPALAYSYRLTNVQGGRPQWPAWWSDGIEQAHDKNAQRWLTEIAHVLAA